jgi:CHASE3 domain sensor protein
MRWQDWSTRRKLITGFGMVLVFSIIIALVGYLNMKNIFQKQKNYILLNSVSEQLFIALDM